MIQSTITSKYQTTVPKKVREELGIGPHDRLRWELEGDNARITLVRRSFLDRVGMIKVGRGSVVEDLRQARAQRGVEGR